MNKIIISDTSCLIVLSKINKLSLLKELFQEVLITEEVKTEYGGPLPNWIIICSVKDKNKQVDLEEKLDVGEASSIALAIEKENSTLIIDENKGRKIAQLLNLDIIGTIGIIVMANKRGILNDVIGTVLKLVNNGFRLSDKIIDMILEKYKK